jgi:hypothetical protein
LAPIAFESSILSHCISIALQQFASFPNPLQLITMKLILAVVASVLAVTGLAAPQIGDPSISVAPPQLFKLQSQVVNDGHNDCGTDKNNLWLTGFHTGAGLSDATMQFNRSTARQAYLNGTQLLTTYPNNTIGPWPMAVSYIPYSSSYSLPPAY